MEPDSEFVDEGYEETPNTSYATSLASNIRRGVTEYGRQFPAYGKHDYGLPVDQREMERNDIQHDKFLLMFDGKLHLSPLDDEPKQILDIGTGNGSWAIEMADRHENSQVLGVDIAATAPTWVPSNCSFEILDIEDEWNLRKHYDFIHGRELLLAIRDWPGLIARAKEHLKPGGHLEFGSTVPDLNSDDDSIPSESSTKEISKIFFEMSKAMGADGWEPAKWKQYFIDQGFEDVQEQIFKIPSNTWPKDKRLKAVGQLELFNFLEYTTAGFAKGYVGVLGGDPNQLEVMLAKSRKEVVDRKIHSYVLFYNVYGRKPMETKVETKEISAESTTV